MIDLVFTFSCFFEACDGIFLNYTWKDGNLQASADMGRNLGRLHDVFVGIDVYGRGCFGDGGYNTNMVNIVRFGT